MSDPYVQISDGTYVDDGETVPKGVAFNRVIWDGQTDFPQPKGLTLEKDDGSRVYWQRSEAAPIVVDKWQLQIVLSRIPSKIGGSGTLLDDTDSLAAKNTETKLIWQGAYTISRGSPLMNAMAPALGLSVADIDAIFREAAGVVA